MSGGWLGDCGDLGLGENGTGLSIAVFGVVVGLCDDGVRKGLRGCLLMVYELLESGVYVFVISVLASMGHRGCESLLGVWKYLGVVWVVVRWCTLV